MLRKRRRKTLLVLGSFSLLLFAVFFQACEKPVKPSTPDTFDKSTMLRQLAEEVILPAFAAYQNQTDSLYLLADKFNNSPDSAQYVRIQKQFIKAYQSYQAISSFEFGPSEETALRANCNTFPCDTQQILGKIKAADYNLGMVGDLDAKGFPALDFLLFDVSGNHAGKYTSLTSGTYAANRRQYLLALLQELKLKAKYIVDKWNQNYFNNFISSTGSSIGSSIGQLVNQLCYDLELLKNAKVGIPAGKMSMGNLFPEKTEGYFSGISKDLALRNLKQLCIIFKGRDSISAGIGLAGYLNHIGAGYGNKKLSEVISAQFQTATGKLEALPGNIAYSVNTAPAEINEAYNALQQLVVLLKVDMTSALGVQITYQDNDGD